MCRCRKYKPEIVWLQLLVFNDTFNKNKNQFYPVINCYTMNEYAYIFALYVYNRNNNLLLPYSCTEKSKKRWTKVWTWKRTPLKWLARQRIHISWVHYRYKLCAIALVCETVVRGENHRAAASHWQMLSKFVLDFISLWTGLELTI